MELEEKREQELLIGTVVGVPGELSRVFYRGDPFDQVDYKEEVLEDECYADEHC